MNVAKAPPLPKRSLAPLLGRGQFELIKKLGEGSFGIVFSAIYKPKTIALAVKIQVLETQVDHELDSLAYEVLIMKKVANCQYTIDLYGVFIQDGHIYMIMDICSGGTLADIIAQDEAKFTANHIR